MERGLLICENRKSGSRQDTQGVEDNAAHDADDQQPGGGNIFLNQCNTGSEPQPD